jgi:8-oxo-dGTP diphosphatase
MSNDKIPRVGISVIIKKDNKVLLGKRKGSHGDGTWAFPGGHLEFKEKVFDCAHREIAEEVGIKINNLKYGPYTEDYFEKEDKHYITIFVISDYLSGEVQNLEPDRCESWEWFDWDKMPDDLFLSIVHLKTTKFNPF